MTGTRQDRGVAVVTGAVAGIGRAAGGEAEGFRCDVRSEAEVSATLRAVAAWRSPIRALVNCAAPFDPTIPLVDTPLERWQIVLDVCLTGTFLMCKHAVPRMVEAGGGAIVNIASNMGHVGGPGRTPYCTAKAGLINLGKALALELAPKGVRVNSVSPGGVLTERVITRHGSAEAAVRNMTPTHPMGRIATTDEIAEAIWFMATESSAFVTGTDLKVDGGYTAA